MKKIRGQELMLFLHGKSIAFATNHTLNISGNTEDTSNKDEGAGDWASSEVSLLNWQITTENLFSLDGEGNNYADLFDAMIAKEPITAVFGMHAETGTEVPSGGWTPKAASATNPMYEGDVVITELDLTAQNGQFANFTATFQGVGALKKKVTA